MSKTEITFIATGDSIIARRIHVSTEPRFQALLGYLRQADVAFTNLEFVTPRKPVVPSAEYGGIHLGMPSWVLDELRQAGFNLFNVATNHALDFGIQGLLDTLEALEERGMIYAGAGHNLGEARSPAYLDTQGGRVALLGAASTFTAGALAAATRIDFPGRPGINPLRYCLEYIVTPEQLEWLKIIDECLGTAAVTRRKEAFGLDIPDPESQSSYRFLGHPFVVGTSTTVRSRPLERDLKEICCWIHDARRQSDFVIVSLHAHEGLAGEMNTHEPAAFIVESARAFIEAGADVIVGHGPHVLRGIEIYRGKPIFYSLGNFIFMCENLQRLPAEMYELYHLPPTATPADVFDFESMDPQGRPKAFHANPEFWQTVMPLCRYRDGDLTRVDLIPVDLQLTLPRTQRGLPVLAEPDVAQTIIDRLAALSKPFNTQIEIFEDRGTLLGQIVNI